MNNRVKISNKIIKRDRQENGLKETMQMKNETNEKHKKERQTQRKKGKGFKIKRKNI